MAKFLRFVGILFMGLTAALTILSGIGTSCVAIDATRYSSMKALADYQWLYVFYVLVTTAIGIFGVRATISLVRGHKTAYRDALVALSSGTLIGAIHIFTSRAIRGSSMPVDVIVYATVFTLAIFLIFGLPKISRMVGFEEGSDNDKTAAGGMTAIVAGMLFLSVHMWAEPTHMIDDVNYADAFHIRMMLVGGGLVLLGIGLLWKSVWCLEQEKGKSRKSIPLFSKR